MTPIATIDDLRAELERVSQRVARALNLAIRGIACAQASVLDMEEPHPGAESVKASLYAEMDRIHAAAWEAERMQSLARRILDAEDTSHRQVAS
ncbi:hypothetical protein LCGC14_0568790 [marine sediment metagenome]|uniref:Uncharacterized protein n=1 Tax=marine sediment metagenome TaxID=412755 RepID=A0A0F9UT53_9ZZZZ|nr:hypothetical protein [Phycisphaerae bacterium]